MRTKRVGFHVLVASACTLALVACGPSQAEIEASLAPNAVEAAQALRQAADEKEQQRKIENRFNTYAISGWTVPGSMGVGPSQMNVLVRGVDHDSPYWQTCEESRCWNLEFIAVAGCDRLDVEMKFYAGDEDDEKSWVLLDTASDSVVSLEPEVRAVTKLGTDVDGDIFARLSNITCT